MLVLCLCQPLFHPRHKSCCHYSAKHAILPPLLQRDGSFVAGSSILPFLWFWLLCLPGASHGHLLLRLCLQRAFKRCSTLVLKRLGPLVDRHDGARGLGEKLEKFQVSKTKISVSSGKSRNFPWSFFIRVPAQSTLSHTQHSWQSLAQFSSLHAWC